LSAQSRQPVGISGSQSRSILAESFPIQCAGVWHTTCAGVAEKGGIGMYNIFYIIGVIVVILFILGYFGLR
jgi:hypothetical protein